MKKDTIQFLLFCLLLAIIIFMMGVIIHAAMEKKESGTPRFHFLFF
jgi:hypothetical protein